MRVDKKDMEFKKRLLIIIGIPLGICALLIAVIVFIGFDIESKAKQANEQRLVFLSRLAVADSLTSLKKDSEQIKNYYAVLENAIPQRDRLVLFPRDINAIGKQNNLDINIILGEGSGVEATQLWLTNFKITGKGNIENLMNFIKALDSGQYLIGFKSLDFTRENDNFRTLLEGQVFSL